MFESSLIRPVSSEQKIDAGLIAESLLFYKQVIIPADAGNIAALVKTIGFGDLLGLINDGYLKLSIVDDALAVASNKDPHDPFEYYDFGAVELYANRDGKELSRSKKLMLAMERAAINKSVAKKASQKIVEKCPSYKLNTILGDDHQISTQARDDTANQDYLLAAVKAVLRYYAPVYTDNLGQLKITRIETEKGLIIEHNIDFLQVNIEALKNGLDPALSMSKVLSHIMSARGEIALASHYLSELTTNPINNALIKIQFDHLLLKGNKNRSQIATFQDNFLEGHSVREAINSGEKNFSDFRKLLDQSSKFKNWLDEKSPDSKIINEYYKASTADTWAEKLPFKALRFVTVMGLGSIASMVLSPGADLAVDFADNFIFDRLIKGWRPNHFVEGPLAKFVRSKE